MKRGVGSYYYRLEKPIDWRHEPYILNTELYQHAREKEWEIKHRGTDPQTQTAYVSFGPMTEMDAVELKLKFSDLFETWKISKL